MEQSFLVAVVVGHAEADQTAQARISEARLPAVHCCVCGGEPSGDARAHEPLHHPHPVTAEDLALEHADRQGAREAQGPRVPPLCRCIHIYLYMG